MCVCVCVYVCVCVLSMQYYTLLPSYTPVYEIQRDKLASHNRRKTQTTHITRKHTKDHQHAICGHLIAWLVIEKYIL